MELGLDAFELAVEDPALLLVTGADTLNNHTSHHSTGCFEDRAKLWKEAK
jgi:hypothetical protein